MERAAIMAKAAELISKKYRYKLNAATMLGQGKNAFQAEIDSACEVIDYLRFNNYFASLIYMEQPKSQGETINRLEYRPLEGSLISNIVLKHRDMGGIHFKGSNSTFNTLWKQVSDNLHLYKSYPRIVVETGGKDFIFAHSSADSLALATAIVRGAFEYQGQKCSAASSAYIPQGGKGNYSQDDIRDKNR